MKRNNRKNGLLACVACVLFITGCDKEKLSLGDSLIHSDSMMDKGEFIRQSQSRQGQDVKYGPAVDESARAAMEKGYRDAVDKEEVIDYVNLTDDGTVNMFPISMNVENMDIRTFASVLSHLSGVNILVSDEVKGTVTADLKNIPWTSALDSVLKTKSLAKHVDKKSGIIRIHDQTTIMALEDFERKRREDLQKTIMLDKASEPMFTESFKLYYTKPSMVKPILDELMGSNAGKTEGALRGLTPQVTLDERRNSLLVKGRKQDLESIAKVIRKLDSRTQQVFIEAFIVEVSDDFEKALGARFGLDGSDTATGIIDNKTINGRVTGLAGMPATGVTAGDSGATLSNLPVNNPFGGIGFLAGIGSSADLKVELTAMEAAGLSKVISNPRIFTLDNQEAVIFQGDEVPYETVSQDGTKVEFKEAGLKLAVLPTVIGDGNLSLAITVNKDTVDTSQDNPPITKSEIKTSMVSKDGSIVVIGGIYTELDSKSADKVPGLGNIPGVGKLFRRDAKESNRKELMIFIAPKIL